MTLKRLFIAVFVLMLVNDPDAKVRQAAVSALGELGVKDIQASMPAR